MSARMTRTVWVLQRDYRFYRAYPTWSLANGDMQMFSPGSKHRWRIRRGTLTLGPIKQKATKP